MKTVFLVFLFIAGIKSESSLAQTQVPGGVTLSDFYKGKPSRMLQCFLSKTNTKNLAQNMRQSYEAEIGPSLNFFRSTQSVRFGYKPGAITWGDETHTKLVQPLTLQFKFRGPGESPAFRIVLSRETISKTDGEFLFVDKLTTYFLRATSLEEGKDQNTIAVGSHTENPSIQYDPSGESPSNLFVNFSKSTRSPLAEVRQTFESGDSYLLQCHICAKSVPGSCVTEEEFKSWYDKNSFKSSKDPHLENTYMGHSPLEFVNL